MKKPLIFSTIILIMFLSYSCEKKPVLPSLSTQSVTEISTFGAVSGGNITSDGGAPIISRGVCWDTATDPTIEDSKTTDNGDLLSYTSKLTQLAPNTTYFVRAYATNSAGTGYGESLSFKTSGDKPVSTASDASNITVNTATLTGLVNPNFLPTTVTFEYGISTSYGSTASPMESPFSDTDENISVKADLSGLIPGTTYHFRIKAENSLGATYSSDFSFKTLGQVPSATAMAATNLQIRAATLNGLVNANLLSTEVKFEWGTSSNYGNTITPAQNPVTGGNNISIASDLSGLTPGTTYHYRIKATNELGTTCSSDMTFKTYGSVPEITSLAVNDLQINSGSISGSINPNYLPTTIIFQWGTTTSYGNTIVYSQNPVSGNTPVNVSAALTGLTAESTYHFRITATNELGSINSADMPFTTYTVADIDNNYYHSITIGTQVWLQKNLQTTRYLNGDEIGTSVPAVLDISGESTPKYQWAYNGDESNVAVYGRLYTWYTITDSRKVCPSGWHIPSDSEWTTLTNFLGGESIAGGKLKETGTLHWLEINTGATDDYGFTGLPGGNRTYNNSSFFGLNGYAAWWSSTPDDANIFSSWARDLGGSQTNIRRGSCPKKTGASVRCVKD